MEGTLLRTFGRHVRRLQRSKGMHVYVETMSRVLKNCLGFSRRFLIVRVLSCEESFTWSLDVPTGSGSGFKRGRQARRIDPAILKYLAIRNGAHSVGIAGQGAQRRIYSCGRLRKNAGLQCSAKLLK
jgi:hypothetical protein